MNGLLRMQAAELWLPGRDSAAWGWNLLALALGLAVPTVVLRSVPTFGLLILALLLGLVLVPRGQLVALLQQTLRLPVTWLVLAFLALAAVTCPGALNPHYAWHYWRMLSGMALATALLHAVVTSLPVERQRQAWQWLLVGMWASLVVALVIVIGEPLFERWGVYEAGNAWTQTRLRYYSSVLAVYLPFCWTAWLAARREDTLKMSWGAVAMTGATLIGVIICAGRAGWVGVAVSLPVTVWLLWRSHGLRLPWAKAVGVLAVMGGVGMALYAVLFGLASVKERIGVIVPARGLGGGRLEIWQMALAHLQDRPLSGIGLNNFRFIPGADFHPHNFVLQLILETGVLGAALAFTLIVMLLVKLYQRARYNPVAVAGFAGLCGFLTAGLTNKSIFNPDWLIILIVVAIFGLSFRSDSLPDGEATRQD